MDMDEYRGNSSISSKVIDTAKRLRKRTHRAEIVDCRCGTTPESEKDRSQSNRNEQEAQDDRKILTARDVTFGRRELERHLKFSIKITIGPHACRDGKPEFSIASEKYVLMLRPNVRFATVLEK